MTQASNQPFPILGRTAWFLLSLGKADYGAFLDDTVAKGFTAVELHVVNHDDRGNRPPFANDGTLLPFTNSVDGAAWDGSLSVAPDFTKPDEAYWRFVDEFIGECEARNLAVFLFPAYVGFDGGSQGWMTAMTANGPERMRAYGAFIADRYRTRPNIVWMLGGDHGSGIHAFTSEQVAVEQAMVDGMLSVTGQQSLQFAAEWHSESIGSDQPTFDRYLTLNGAYSHSGETATQMRRAYADSSQGIRPAFLVEGAYDEEGPDGTNSNSNATQPTRRFVWRAWLNGIAGYIQGNGYLWPFQPGWASHLNSQGQQDLARLNAFIRSIRWSELVPDGLGTIGTLVTEGQGLIDQDNYVAAAATPDGSLLVAYFGPSHASSVTIDMSKLRGPARVRWFDPTSGEYVEVGTVPNSGNLNFTPPAANSAGDGDWVLRLDA
jgi:hypothetical protein